MSGWRPYLLLVLLATAPVLAKEEPATYRFTLNGDPITPRIHSLHGDPESPRTGDVIEVSDYLIVLDEPGDYRFRIDWKDVASPVYRKVGDEERLVAAAAKKSGKVTFQGLDAKARAGLRGVRLAVWSDEIASLLTDLDAERCVLTLDDGIGGDGPGLGLPAGLRHLRVSQPTAARLARTLEGLPALRSLIVNGYGKNLEAAPIAKLQDLALLDLTAKSLRGNESLGKLTALTDLDLTLYSGTLDLGAVARIKALRRLSLSILPVKDLTALGAHPALRWIKVEMSPLETLPTEPLPMLRRLDVMGTRLSDKAVAAFAKRHPECRIRHRMDDVLRVELRGATRFRIRSGGTCHRDRKEEKTLLEITSPGEVARIATKIRIEGPSPGCMCCGDPTLEFYRGDRLVAELGFHHGRALRWPGVWPFDAELTAESAAFLKKLLAEHGVKVR